MQIAYLILAHQNPPLVARLARLLLAHGGIVAIHYDLNAGSKALKALKEELGPLADRIVWPKRERIGWGEWSMVQATLNGLEALAASGHTLDYVHLMSGVDYPIRPLAEFRDYLARSGGKNFIECVDMNQQVWVKGGLYHERYQYRHPFNWKKRRKLFDRTYDVQKKLGLKRAFPAPMRPHMGSQWWTLTWSACEEVLRAGRNRKFVSFFKTVWIPDEMFIQSVLGTALVASQRSAACLTLYQFTGYGVPVVYHNDHADYLGRQPFFFARKLSAHADRLRDALDQHASGHRRVALLPNAAFGHRTEEYEQFRAKAAVPAPGERLISYDKDHWRGDLAFLKKPVLVVLGASHEELRFIRDILHSAGTLTCHGALFHPSRIEFAGDAERFAGYGTGDIALRNHNRQNFLFDIIRDSKPGVTGFLLPRTMDENIRDRVLWTEWFRVLIVRGNVMRAYQEQRQRQHQLKASQHLAVEQQAQMMSENAAIDADELIVEAQADEGPMRSEEAGAPPAEETEAFLKFQTDYESYHAEVWKNCSDAKFKFREIDLMDESWPDALTDFMAQSLPVSPEYVHQLQQRRETLVLRAQELSNPYARIRGARWLVRNHVDQRRRQAHIATLNRMAMGRLSRLSRPTLAVFGASDEELRFIQSLLNATGVFACHGALLHPQLFETEKSAKAAAGRRKPELRVRSRKLTGLLADALSGPEHGVPGILLPWNMDQDMGSRLIRLEPIRALVVRGNLLRAFVDQQRRDRVGSPASTTAALEPTDPIWVAPKQFERFRSDYEKYHSDLWDDCKSAGSLLFREIDLMNETWLENLIDFIEYAMPLPGGRRIRDRLTRELAVQHVGTLSDPFARITNANWLVSNLIPAKHKEAYALALARSVAVRAEVAGRELEPWPAASPAAAPAGHGEEPPLQRMAGE